MADLIVQLARDATPLGFLCFQELTRDGDDLLPEPVELSLCHCPKGLRPLQPRPHRDHQLFRLEGFGDVILGPQFYPFQGVFPARFGSQENEGDGHPLPAGADCTVECQPVHPRHHDIRQDQVRADLAHHLEPL